jgi:ribosomal protein L32
MLGLHIPEAASSPEDEPKIVIDLTEPMDNNAAAEDDKAPPVPSLVPVVTCPPKLKPTVGARIKVWFTNKKRYYRGRILDIKVGNRYFIHWDVGSHVPSWEELRPCNNTRSKRCNDRWHVIPEVIICKHCGRYGHERRSNASCLLHKARKAEIAEMNE